jgi:hypothetical protein
MSASVPEILHQKNSESSSHVSVSADPFSKHLPKDYVLKFIRRQEFQHLGGKGQRIASSRPDGPGHTGDPVSKTQGLGMLLRGRALAQHA